MSNVLNENKRIFTFILVLLFILLVVVYFTLVRPLERQQESAENNVNTLNDEIAAYEARLENDSGGMDVETLLLEKKVPLTPELESFLLTLQEIELVSDSIIDNVRFRYDGELPESLIAEDEEIEGETPVESGEESLEEDDATVTVAEDENKPENLRVITAEIDVRTSNYETFQNFLTEIEKRERITRVDRLEFEKPAELALIENPSEEIVVTIEVSTFYYEE